MAKVAWDGICMSGGDLDKSEQEKIKKLIDEFGKTLEEHCSENKICKKSLFEIILYHIKRNAIKQNCIVSGFVINLQNRHSGFIASCITPTK